MENQPKKRGRPAKAKKLNEAASSESDPKAPSVTGSEDAPTEISPMATGLMDENENLPVSNSKKSAKKEKKKETAEERAARYKKLGEGLAQYREGMKNMSAEEKADYKARRAEKSRHNRKRKQAGLLFNVYGFRRMLRKTLGTKKVTYEAAIYTTAVIEYMTAEVLELSGNCAMDFKKKRILPRHIMLAIRKDEELNKFVPPGTLFHSSGVPTKAIHEVLLNTRVKSSVFTAIKNYDDFE